METINWIDDQRDYSDIHQHTHTNHNQIAARPGYNAQSIFNSIRHYSIQPTHMCHIQQVNDNISKQMPRTTVDRAVLCQYIHVSYVSLCRFMVWISFHLSPHSLFSLSGSPSIRCCAYQLLYLLITHTRTHIYIYVLISRIGHRRLRIRPGLESANAKSYPSRVQIYAFDVVRHNTTDLWASSVVDTKIISSLSLLPLSPLLLLLTLSSIVHRLSW